MGQDIRNMFKEDKSPSSKKLDEGHLKRFEAKLDADLPTQKSGSNFMILKIAAIFIVVLGVGAFFLNNDQSSRSTPVVVNPEAKEAQTKLPVKEIQLSDVSPEFKKIENYYIAGINMELSKLEVNSANKELIDSFMNKMGELNKEYKRLNTEINEAGINEQTIEAMVQNLQFRLELLYKLKNKLKEIKESKNHKNENYKI